MLTPCFGTWTFGPAVQNNESTSNCCMSCESNKISASYKHTWATFSITLIGAILTFVVGYERPWGKLSHFGDDVTQLLKYSFGSPLWYAGAVLISWVLTIVIIPILILSNQVLSSHSKNQAWYWQHGLTHTGSSWAYFNHGFTCKFLIFSFIPVFKKNKNLF